jgi:RimJ/RimL family protein N-acetyltransferase
MSTPVITPPAQIETSRLVLRPYQPGDAEAYLRAIQANWDHLYEFLPPQQEAMRSAADAAGVIAWLAEMWERREVFVYGAWERATGEFTAEAYLANPDWHVPSIEVGYFVVSAKTGQGYASEAARALVACAFTHLGAVRVDLQCAADNLASQRVAQRLGFTLEGCQRERQRKKNGQLVDRLWYGLLKAEAGENP